LTDLKRGQKVGGHRGYFLKGKGVKLALGIANYGLNFLEKKGYELFYSPAIINEVTLRGSCQLQSIEEDVYKL
jgi:seryl-tRNA synthetase